MSKVSSVLRVVGVLFLYYAVAVLLISCGIDSLTATVCLDIAATTPIVIWWRSDRGNRIPVRDSKVNLVALACALAFVFMVGQLTGTMVEGLFGPGSFGQYRENLHANATMALLLTVVVAPVAEECLVRGYIYQQLRRGFGLWVAWFAQAAIFAFMHGTLVHAGPTFLSGLFLALLYERTGSLLWPIGFHMVYNVMALFMGGALVPAAWCTPWMVVPLYISCIALLVMMYAKTIKIPFCHEVVSVEVPDGAPELVARPVEKREEERYGSQEVDEEEDD